ncbi:uncharacterized protein LOC142908816 [Petromyzon marinus]|uniref:uncharacterized protein LOC142908816 n=1 Tax=Petromyzon marinus TaxID=7757 RepID=UPI003F6EF6FD
MAMSKLYKLGLLFPFILPLLLLHHLVTCSSHAPLFPLNVRLESRDLLATLCWDPVEAAPSGDGGDRPPLVDPLTINSTTTTTTNSTFLNVTYTVQSKLFRRARWQTVCAATTETRCDVSSALDDPGGRYLLRVRLSFSSSPSRSSPWVALVVVPLRETVLSAPSFTLRLDKLTLGKEEEGDGEEEEEDEECGVVGDDEDNDDDDVHDAGDDDRRDYNVEVDGDDFDDDDDVRDDDDDDRRDGGDDNGRDGGDDDGRDGDDDGRDGGDDTGRDGGDDDGHDDDDDDRDGGDDDGRDGGDDNGHDDDDDDRDGGDDDGRDGGDDDGRDDGDDDGRDGGDDDGRDDDDDGRDGGDDDDRDGGDDDGHNGGDDDRRDDDVEVDGDNLDDGGPGEAGELEAAVDGEPEVWKLSLLVSVGRGLRTLVSHDVEFHHQVDISTRGGVRRTERFIGCRYQHQMMLLPGREDEYCVRVRMVADLPRWKAGEWSPLSCVSVPPPHSTVAPRVGVDTDGQVTAVVGQKVALLRCVLWGAAVVVVQANWLKASRDDVWAGANLAALSPLHGTAYTNSSLAGRLRFRVGVPPGDVSLELLDVQAGDGGLFLCHVATFPHGNYEGRVSLSVIDVDATGSSPSGDVDATGSSPSGDVDATGSSRSTDVDATGSSRSTDVNDTGSSRSTDVDATTAVCCTPVELTTFGPNRQLDTRTEKAAAAGRASWAAPAAILAVSLALVATLLLLLLLYRRRRRRQQQHWQEPWGPTEDSHTLPKAPRRNAEGDRGYLLTLESGNTADMELHELPPQPQHQDSGAGSYDYTVFTDEDDDEEWKEDF